MECIDFTNCETMRVEYISHRSLDDLRRLLEITDALSVTVNPSEYFEVLKPARNCPQRNYYGKQTCS